MRRCSSSGGMPTTKLLMPLPMTQLLASHTGHGRATEATKRVLACKQFEKSWFCHRQRTQNMDSVVPNPMPFSGPSAQCTLAVLEAGRDLGDETRRHL